MLSSEFTRLSIEGLTVPSLALSIRSGGKAVFECDYVPDSSGRVTVYDLDKVLSALPGEHYNDITISLGDLVLEPLVIRVLNCSLPLNMPGETFVEEFFLTPFVEGERDTLVGRHELLTVYCQTGTEVEAVCTFYSEEGLSTRTMKLADASGWTEIDVSPDRFVVADGRQLISVAVKCGDRRMRYRVLNHAPEAGPTFIFRNCFGAWETFSCTGTKETQPAYTRSQAHVLGTLRNYHIEEVLSYKALSGPLRPGMVAVALDLGRSRDVFLLGRDGTVGLDVTVTDCDLKHSNDIRELSEVSFTYRLADNHTARIDAVRPHRLFDHTFDDTYE